MSLNNWLDEFTSVNEFTVVLEKYRYGKELRLAKYVMESMTIEQKAFIDPMVRGAVYELSCFVLAEKVIDRRIPVSFDNPTTWWDMFKIRFFSEWLLRKFPPLYTLTTKYVDFKEYATYPQLKEHLDISERGEVVMRCVSRITGENKHNHIYIEREEITNGNIS